MKREIRFQLIDITNGIKYDSLTIEELSFGQWEIEGRYYKDGYYDKIGDLASIPRKDYCYIQEEGTEFIWREFTGLLDKNKNPIFEGDIVYYSIMMTGNIGVVEMNCGTWILRETVKGGDILTELFSLTDCCIKGNIYEDSNLLNN